MVKENETFPADLVLLSTSSSSGKCFVMTANLDGETNLKPLSPAKITKHLKVNYYLNFFYQLLVFLPHSLFSLFNNKILSSKKLRSTTQVCKDIRIRKSFIIYLNLFYLYKLRTAYKRNGFLLVWLLSILTMQFAQFMAEIMHFWLFVQVQFEALNLDIGHFNSSKPKQCKQYSRVQDGRVYSKVVRDLIQCLLPPTPPSFPTLNGFNLHKITKCFILVSCGVEFYFGSDRV